MHGSIEKQWMFLKTYLINPVELDWIFLEESGLSVCVAFFFLFLKKKIKDPS